MERGRSIYSANCIACHNSDPRLRGAIGPEVSGSTLELLKLRIVDGTYPVNYKPKRSSRAMPKLPHLDREIPAIHAYLNSGNQ